MTKVFEKTARFCLLALSLAGLGLVLVDSYLRIPFRYAWNYVEPAVQVVLNRIHETPLLYRDIHTPPFIINPYNPLYFYLSYPLTFLTGMNFTAPRIVGLVSALVSALFIYLLLKKHGVARLAAYLSAALFLLVPVVTQEIVVVRPDMTALAFSLAGLYFLPNVWISAFFFTAAYFTKQSYVAAGLSAFLFLLLDRQPKKAMVLAAVSGLAAVFLTVLWNTWTNGDYFLNQKLNIHKPVLWPLFLLLWRRFLEGHWFFLVTAFLAAFVSWKEPKARIFHLYFAVNLFLTVSMAKVGSDMNFFIELCAAGCLLWGMGDRWKRGLVAVFLGVQLSYGAFLAYGQFKISREQLASVRQLDEVSDFVRRIPGDMLAENLAILMAAGKPVIYEPYEFTQMSNAGVWDESLIVDRIRAKEFPVILLNTNIHRVKRTGRFSVAFIQAMRDHYEIKGMKHGHIFYVPIATQRKAR